MALDPTLTMVASEFRDELHRQVTPLFSRLLAQVQAGPSITAAGAAVGIPEHFMTQIQSYMSQMVHSVVPLAIQMRTMGDPNTAAATAFGAIMPQMGQGLIDRAVRQVDLATSGAQMGVGGFDLDRAASYDALRVDQQARLTRMADDQGRTLTSGFAPTTYERQKAITDIAQLAIDTPAIQRLKGLTTDWGDRILDVIELMGSQVDVLSMSSDQQARFAQEVGVSAMQLYELSAITGKSAHAITQQSRGAQATPDIQFALNLLQGAEKEKFTTMFRGLEQSFGVNVANLLLPIVVNARPTDQQRALMTAMGGAYGQLAQAAKLQMASAHDPTLRKAADAAYIAAQASIQQQTQSRQFALMGLQTSRTDLRDAARGLMQTSDMRKPIQSMLDELRRSRPGATEEDAIRALQTRSSRVAGGLMLDGPQAGAVDPTKVLGPAIMRASDDFATLAASSSRTVADLSSSLMSMDGAVDKVTAAFNKLHEFLLGSARTADEGAIETQRRAGEVLRSSLDFFRGTTPTTPSTPPVHRQGGSLDATGKLIEDFGTGTPATLHGTEGVITKPQLEKVVSSAIEAGKQSQQSIPIITPKETVKQPLQKIDSPVLPQLHGVSTLSPAQSAITEQQISQLISSVSDIKTELMKDDVTPEKLGKILLPMMDPGKKGQPLTAKELTQAISSTLRLDKPVHNDHGITEKELNQAISSVLEMGKVAPAEIPPDVYKGLFGEFDNATKGIADAHTELSKKATAPEVPTQPLTPGENLDPKITEILETLKKMTNFIEQVARNSTDIKDSNNRMVKSTSKMMGSRA